MFWKTKADTFLVFQLFNLPLSLYSSFSMKMFSIVRRGHTNHSFFSGYCKLAQVVKVLVPSSLKFRVQFSPLYLRYDILAYTQKQRNIFSSWKDAVLKKTISPLVSACPQNDMSLHEIVLYAGRLW